MTDKECVPSLKRCYHAMKRDKGRPSLAKPFSYLFLSGNTRSFHIDSRLPHGRRVSPKELEEQRKQHPWSIPNG